MEETRYLTFLFYGFAAAWVILLLYVISIARRGARLKRELEDLKQLTPHSETVQETSKR